MNLMDKKVVAFSLSLLPMMISSGMFYSVLSLYISEELKANKMQIGMLFTIGALTGVLTSILLGKAADKFGKKTLVILSQVLFAIVMLSYSLINYYIYALPIHVVEGFAWAMLGSSAPALIADIAKKGHRGEAMGIYNTVWNLGWVIWPFLGGSLAEFFGFRTMLLASFLMITFGIVLSSYVLSNE